MAQKKNSVFKRGITSFKATLGISGKAQEMKVIKKKTEDELEDEKLMHAILKSDIEIIINWDRSWNFFGMIEGRKTAVTPLSVLCRPQLCDALKECDPEQQRRLVRFALDKGADPWRTSDDSNDSNARAITDTVYQGDVEILKIFLERGLATKEQLADYRLYGASLLHMAAYDSRLEMIQFLVEEVEMDPKLKDGNGQQPLFWIFARGPVGLDAANYLVLECGCDPKEKVAMMKDRKDQVKGADNTDGTYLSPLSIAIGSFPEFVEDYLKSQFQIVSNRGLARTVRFSWKNLLTERVLREGSEGKEYVYIAPRFAKIKEAPTITWETLNWDRDPTNMKTYIEMMLQNDCKHALQFPIIRKPTVMMWEDFSMGCFARQVGSFVVIWAMVIVAMFQWPSRGDDGVEALKEAGVDAVFASPVLSRVCMFVTIPFVFYLVYIEYKELTAGGRWKTYIKDKWNYADFFLLCSVIFLCIIVNQVNGTTDYATFLWSDRVIGALAVVVNIMLSVKAIQFASVPAITSHMVSMLLLMLRDIYIFGLVWILLYIGYSQALWMLWKNTVKETELADLIAAIPEPGSIEDEMYLWWDPFIHLWNWMLGDGVGDFPETLGNMDYLEEQVLAFMLHYSWIIIMTIMLFNMLIAMMGNTYETVADEQKAESNLNFVDRVQNLWHCAGGIRNAKHHKKLWDQSDCNTDEKLKTINYEDDEDDVTPEWAKQLGEKIDQLNEKMKDVAMASKPKKAVSAHVGKRRASLFAQNTRQIRKRLYVKVESATKLRNADVGSQSDPYCKVLVCKGNGNGDGLTTLLSDKTDVVSDTCEPVWNWTSGELYAKGFDTLVFQIMDKDPKKKKDDHLGDVIITLPQLNAKGGTINDWFDIIYKKIPHGRIKLQVEWVSIMPETLDTQKRIEQALSPRGKKGPMRLKLDSQSMSPATPFSSQGHQEFDEKESTNDQHHVNLLDVPDLESLTDKIARVNNNMSFAEDTRVSSSAIKIHDSNPNLLDFAANPVLLEQKEEKMGSIGEETLLESRGRNESGAVHINI